MHLGKRHKRSKSFGSPNPGGRTRSSPWIWTGPTPDAVTALAVHQQMQHKPLTAFQITKHSKYRNIMDMKKFFRSYNFYEQLCATRFASQEDMDKLLKLTRTEETECLSRYWDGVVKISTIKENPWRNMSLTLNFLEHLSKSYQQFVFNYVKIYKSRLILQDTFSETSISAIKNQMCNRKEIKISSLHWESNRFSKCLDAWPWSFKRQMDFLGF